MMIAEILAFRPLRRIVGYPRRLCNRFRSLCYTTQCRIYSIVNQGRLELGRGVRMSVPVRIDGSGYVIIHSGVCFGYRKAPIIGSGEILIQARSADAIVEWHEKTMTNNNISVVANDRITIGAGCQIGDLVTIYDCDFHEIDPVHRNRSCGPTSPVKIGNNVWLGSRVMVLKGVTIGDNSVIAAGSVVTKSLPANCVAAGVPARIIKNIRENSELM